MSDVTEFVQVGERTGTGFWDATATFSNPPAGMRGYKYWAEFDHQPVGLDEAVRIFKEIAETDMSWWRAQFSGFLEQRVNESGKLVYAIRERSPITFVSA
jgi:hypothetical protein